MDRKKASDVLKHYGNPEIKVAGNRLTFSRQTESDLIEIESKSDDDLIHQWKSLVFINDVVGQVSINEMQRISLIELEMDSRDIEPEPLQSWLENEILKFDSQGFF